VIPLIPRAHITAWRGTVPWADDAQVEQDLVLSRALVEIFNEPAAAAQILLRGGTALHNLLVSPPARQPLSPGGPGWIARSSPG